MKSQRLVASALFGLGLFSSFALASGDFKWSSVAMGGGGFVSAVVASPVDENLFYARTDVGGAYRWNESSSKWESIMDWVDVSERGLLGVEAIAVDPKQSGTVYMVTGTSYWNYGRSAFLRSTDRGTSWEVVYTWDTTGAKGGNVAWFNAHGNGMGRGNGEALAVDPNNPDKMFYGSKNRGLWKSTDNGSTWAHVDAWTSAAGSDTTWNGSGFSFVQFAPGSSDVLYAGFLREGTTASGTFENVFTSTDGGASWEALPIPDSLRETAGGSIVRLMPQRAVVSSDGSKLTVTFADGAGPHSMGWDEGWGPIWDGFGRGAVLQYDVSAKLWSDVSPEDFIDDGKTGASDYDKTDYSDYENYQYIAPYGGIAINPNNSDEMIVTTEGYRGPQFWYTATSDTSGSWNDQWGANIYRTTDGGKTWVASFKYYWMEGGYYPTTQQMDDNGIGWMHGGSIHWSGSVAIDPNNPERVFVTSGNGVFRCDNISDYTVIPAGTFDTTTNYYYSNDEAVQSQVWKVSSHGIEETVPEEVVSIPGGPLISVIGDYDGFRHTDIAEYPSYRHRTSVSGTSVSLGSTRGLAYAPKSGKLVKVADARSYAAQYNTIPIEPLSFSSDSGKTWTVGTYSSLDSSYKKGSAAISADGSVAIWVPSEGTTTVYRYANSSYSAVTGIDNAAYVVGDPENADVFYAYDKTAGEFFKSSDQGATFSKVSTPGKSDFKKFRAIPGYEGDLWLPVSIAAEDGSQSGKLLHSTDGGTTWDAVSGVGFCEAVGYGVSQTGTGYPAIYVFASIAGEVGVFGSDDKGGTWTRLNDDSHEYGGLANGEFVMGDMNTYGVVYMSTAGRGISARVPSDWSMGTSSSTSAISGQKDSPKPGLLFSKLATLEGLDLNLTVNGAKVSVSVFDLKGSRVYGKSFTSSTVIPLGETVQSRGTYIVRVTSGSTLMLAAKVFIAK